MEKKKKHFYDTLFNGLFPSSLAARARTIKYGNIECLGFESRPLHKLCNVLTN